MFCTILMRNTFYRYKVANRVFGIMILYHICRICLQSYKLSEEKSAVIPFVFIRREVVGFVLAA